MPAWIRYTLYRIVVFAVILTGLLLLQVNPYIATFVAAILGLIVSALFFRKTRNEVALELANRSRRTGTERAPKKRTDDAEEDSLNV